MVAQGKIWLNAHSIPERRQKYRGPCQVIAAISYLHEVVEVTTVTSATSSGLSRHILCKTSLRGIPAGSNARR